MVSPIEVLGQPLDRDTLLAILKWIGGLSAGAAAGFALRFSRRSRSSFLNRFRNLPGKNALGEAKRYFGPEIADAIPFRLPGSKDQYIAVLQSQPSESEIYFRGKLSILRGARGCYEIVTTEVEQFRHAAALDGYFGAVDISGTGHQDIFVVSHSAGSGASSIDVELYDPETSERYRITWFKTHHVVPPDITYTGDFSRKPHAKQWLRDHAAKVSGFYRDPSLSRQDRIFHDAQTMWVATHGSGFVQGKIRSDYYRGKIPHLDEAHCTVDDGDYLWASFFKGPVVGYQKSRNRYFILFVPPTQYHWVTNLLIGKRYIWLEVHTAIEKPRGLLVVERDTLQMQVLPVPVPLEIPEWYVELFLSGNLTVENGCLRLNSVPVELPETVNPQLEFDNVLIADQVWAKRG
jgi:hypothetical protein